MSFLVKFVLVCLSLVAPVLASAVPTEPVSLSRADESARILRQRVASNPADAEAYNLLCRIYFLTDDWEQAINNGERAVQLRPKTAAYHLWLGRSYGRKAERANPVIAFILARKVVREFELAHQIDPADWDTTRDLAEFYIEAPGIVGGGQGKAETLAAQIETQDPVGASLIRGMLASKRKQWNEAERQYKLAVERSGGTAAAWLELAHHYRNVRNWSAFDSAIQQALNSARRTPGDLFDAGEMLNAAGRMLPQAAELLRNYLHGQLSEEYGTAFRAHYLLGQVLEKQGDQRGAAGEYRSALALAAKFQPAQQALERLGL